MTPLIWIGLGLAGLLLLIGIIVSVASQRSLVDERLGRYTEDAVDGRGGDGATPLTDWINARVERSSFGDRLGKQLAQADIKFKPGEYIALIIISTFALGAFGWVYGGGGFPDNGPYFAVLGAIVGPFLPRLYVKRQQKQRLTRFNEQLPDMLNLMVNGLRAGYSQMQAMESVSKELPPPISDEFRRVVREMQLGITMTQSLDNLIRRIPSDDLDFIITAINIQRESGGNLAEILDIISYTIRERIRIKREIEVMTAQVLFSGRILAIMPVALAFFLWGANRSYMQQFFDPPLIFNLVPCGVPILMCGALMIIAGYFAMNRVADIEV